MVELESPLQQHLPFTVCAEWCETAEEERNDEAHTLQVPERREGKIKVIKQQHLPLAVLKRWNMKTNYFIRSSVATTPTACGIETHKTLLLGSYLHH